MAEVAVPLVGEVVDWRMLLFPVVYRASAQLPTPSARVHIVWTSQRGSDQGCTFRVIDTSRHRWKLCLKTLHFQDVIRDIRHKRVRAYIVTQLNKVVEKTANISVKNL
jgi:hypothetical protein